MKNLPSNNFKTIFALSTKVGTQRIYLIIQQLFQKISENNVMFESYG